LDFLDDDDDAYSNFTEPIRNQ